MLSFVVALVHFQSLKITYVCSKPCLFIPYLVNINHDQVIEYVNPQYLDEITYASDVASNNFAPTIIFT